MKFSFYLIPVLALAAVSCGKFKPWEPPPKPCSDPLKCISIKSVNDSKCQFPFNWNNGNLIQARNSHPKDVVILTYRERVRHINQLLPDESIVKTVRVSTGTPEPLGCEVTGSEQEAFDIWSYSKIAACFESGSCVISKPTPGPKPTETRTQTCERECATNGKFCVTAKLDTTKPDEKKLSNGISSLASQLGSAVPPMLIDIHEITESMTALTKYECKHGPMTVNANSGVLSSGSDCWLGFEVGSKGVSSVDLILPSTLIGNLRQNSPEFEIKFTDVATAPLISVFDESSPPVEFGDRVEIMKGGSSQVSFESVETYCLRLKIEPPG